MFQFSKPLKKWLGRGGQEQESGGGEEVESSSSGTGTGGGGAEVAPFLVRTDDDGDIRKQKVKEDDDERVAAAEMDDLVLYGVSSAVSSTGAGVASALPYHDDEEDDDDDMLDLDLAKAGLEECESSIEDSAFGADDILKIDFIAELPFELAVKILIYLPPTSAMSSVSKIWNIVANDNTIWKKFYTTTYGKLCSQTLDPNSSFFSSLATREDKQMLQRALLDQAQARDWKTLFCKRKRLLQNWKEGLFDQKFLDGHADAVYCLQFDSQKIISGSRDRTIKIWNIHTATCTSTLSGHEGSVLCLQYNNTYIISGSSDSTIRIWDIASGKCIRVLRGHEQPVLDIQFYGPDKIVSSSKDWTIKIWNIHTGALESSLVGHTAAVNSIHVDKDLLASASGDSTIRVWDLLAALDVSKNTPYQAEISTPLKVLKGHERGLACVQFHDSKIVSGSNDKSIKVWDSVTGNCVATLEGHEGLVRTLAFDGHHLVSGSYDQSIKVWDSVSGNLMLNMLHAHKSWVFHVQIDACRIVSSSQDFKIIIWDFSNGESYDEIM